MLIDSLPLFSTNRGIQQPKVSYLKEMPFTIDVGLEVRTNGGLVDYKCSTQKQQQDSKTEKKKRTQVQCLREH